MYIKKLSPLPLNPSIFYIKSSQLASQACGVSLHEGCRLNGNQDCGGKRSSSESIIDVSESHFWKKSTFLFQKCSLCSKNIFPTGWKCECNSFVFFHLSYSTEIHIALHDPNSIDSRCWFVIFNRLLFKYCSSGVGLELPWGLKYFTNRETRHFSRYRLKILKYKINLKKI